MACRSLILIAATLFACWVQGAKVKVQLTHTKHNVVKGKKAGDTEIADLADVQKFFPKISTKEEGESSFKDNGPDEFVDNIASSLGDFQAELLVAGQSASKVCARDVKRFCGAGAMKNKHPIHCLGLLPDNQRSQIHRLCKLHLQESLSFVCAADMDNLDCDAVMDTKIDCLTEGIEKLSEDCADQVRLTAKVIAKVNNADISVISEEGETTKVHNSEFENENWQCPADFISHHTHAPCCFFAGDCSSGEGSNKFKCAQTRCRANKGQWSLKDEEGFELGGHLCCPRRKEDGWYANGYSTYIFLIVAAIVVYWQRARVLEFYRVAKTNALRDAYQVQLPGMAIELTTFFNSIFSAVKKEDADFVKAPIPKTSDKTVDGSAMYGGL